MKIVYKISISVSIILFIFFLQFLTNHYLERRKESSFLVTTIKEYDLVDLGEYFLIYTFDGSGSIVFGGTLPKSERVKRMLMNDHLDRQNLREYLIFELPEDSFPDPLIYWGNYDKDEEIEIFYFGILGNRFGGPYQLNQDGTLSKNDNTFWIRLLTFPLRIMIIPVYIFFSIILLIVVIKK